MTGALSPFLFRLIAAPVAELTRPFDEAALPPRPLFIGCGLIAEPINRSLGQLRRPCVGSQPWPALSAPIDQSADCRRNCRPIARLPGHGIVRARSSAAG
jgi:hypothetical protein